MIDSLIKALFSCSHRKLAFPITLRHNPRVPGSRYGRRTYMICLDCGKELPYNWDEMRMERVEPVALDSLVRQLASWFETVRTAFSKGVLSNIRCRITRDEAQAGRPWHIRIGRSAAINFARPAKTRNDVHQDPRYAHWNNLPRAVPREQAIPLRTIDHADDR